MLHVIRIHAVEYSERRGVEEEDMSLDTGFRHVEPRAEVYASVQWVFGGDMVAGRLAAEPQTG